MPNLVDVSYAQTGQSTSTNKLGMREMQARAYEACNSRGDSLPPDRKCRAQLFA